MNIKLQDLLNEVVSAAGDDEIKKDVAAAFLQTLHYQLTGRLPINFQANFFQPPQYGLTDDDAQQSQAHSGNQDFYPVQKIENFQ